MPIIPAKIQPLYKTYLDKALSLLPKTKLKFPNGLTRGFDGLYYVPSSVDGQIRVYTLTKDNKLQLIDSIHTGMPLDNISPDAKGDLYVPGFPSLMGTTKAMKDPRNLDSPSTVFRIRKTVDVGPDGVRSVDYRVEKVLEDREGKVISGATTVRHDVKTGRLFIGGEYLGSSVSMLLTRFSCAEPFFDGLRPRISDPPRCKPGTNKEL